MSTRLGVRRNGEVVAAEKRQGPDGKDYYDIQACCEAAQFSCSAPCHDLSTTPRDHSVTDSVGSEGVRVVKRRHADE